MEEWTFKKHKWCFPTEGAKSLQPKYLRNLHTIKANSKDIPKEAREQINSFINSFNATDTPAGNNSYGDSYNINFVSDM